MYTSTVGAFFFCDFVVLFIFLLFLKNHFVGCKSFLKINLHLFPLLSFAVILSITTNVWSKSLIIALKEEYLKEEINLATGINVQDCLHIFKPEMQD